jgi:hypothetical protein
MSVMTTAAVIAAKEVVQRGTDGPVRVTERNGVLITVTPGRVHLSRLLPLPDHVAISAVQAGGVVAQGMSVMDSLPA